MAITVVGSATAATAAGTAITPTGAASGDLLLFFLTAFQGGGVTSVTPPAGATLVCTSSYSETHGGGVTTIWCYKMLLSGAPAATYAFTVNPAAGFGGPDVATICLRGVDQTTPVDTSSTGNGSPSGGTTITAPSLTTALANELLVWFWWGNDTALSSNPSGFTQQLSQAAPLTAAPEAIFTKTQVAAGATGAVTASTAPTTDDWLVCMIAVESSGGAAATVLPFGVWLQ